MFKTLKIIVFLFIGSAILGWFLTAPSYVNSKDFTGLQGSVEKGKTVYHQSGCSSCHAAPNATDDAKNILSGGKHFASDFGTFYAPNISPDPVQGIGKWTLIDLANAMQKGVSPNGRHYYPAFPYTSYARMTNQDITDLYSFLNTLPRSATPSRPHDVAFPFNMRRGLGLWKLAFVKDYATEQTKNQDTQLLRGRYLVEGSGHCGECHTSRNLLGGLNYQQWLAGGPNPDGPGTIPNITPHETGLGSWTTSEIVEYLRSGFTPDFDSASGSMVDVIENTSQLPAEDLQAIANYLKSIPPISNQ